MASTLKFHGIANLKAILMVLRARVNSPMSRMSSEKLSLTVARLGGCSGSTIVDVEQFYGHLVTLGFVELDPPS